MPRIDSDHSMLLLYEIEVVESDRRQGLAKRGINYLREECLVKPIKKTWVFPNRSNQSPLLPLAAVEAGTG
ncbi:MAG: hypothetical protein P1R58_09760 [bacterium]|nr:hypothetical protein [bacterium]